MKRTVATLSVLILALPVFGSAPGGMTGRLTGVDGRPAAGFQVVLVTPEGDPAATAETDSKGAYRIDEVAPGEYDIGVVSPSGEPSPVLAAPTGVPAGKLVVRDIRLMAADGPPVSLAPASGLGVWWAGMSRSRKIWTVVGSLTGIGLLFGATQDDQVAYEPPVTPFRVD